MSATGPQPGASTAVNLLITSTANDYLSAYVIQFSDITLTNAAGKSVSLLSAPQTVEFIHANGMLESMLSVEVPQDEYTSATATIESLDVDCVTNNPPGFSPPVGIMTATYAYGAAIPASFITVNLPKPITIDSAHGALLLDLRVSQSANISTCNAAGGEPYTLTPTFDLTSFTPAFQPTSAANGKELDLNGVVTAIVADGSSFTVAGSDGPTWSVTSNAGTVYQGIAGSAALVAGMPVDMDVAIQADGSMLATRVAVFDTNTTDLTIMRGPVLFLSDAGPEIENYYTMAQGQLFNFFPASISNGSTLTMSYSSAQFQISGQFTNVSALPFNASFNAANAVPGQNTYITTHSANFGDGPNLVEAATITLAPQVINGTISGIATDGNFTTYTLTLAAYDVFANFAQQAGQTSLLINPNTVVIYADSDTQMLNSNPVAIGAVQRFYGLVFNDNGKLRMDCAVVMDGVTP